MALCAFLNSHLNDDVVILNHQRVRLDVAGEREGPTRFITSLGPARHILTICEGKITGQYAYYERYTVSLSGNSKNIQNIE